MIAPLLAAALLAAVLTSCQQARADGMPDDPCLRPRGQPWEEVIPYQRPGGQSAHEVDEPGTLWLLLPGLGGVAGLVSWLRWRKRRRD